MENLGFSNEDYLNLIIIYGECNRITDRTCRLFAERYPERPTPNHNIIKRLLQNCAQFGSFHRKRNRQKRLVDNENIQIDVLGYFSAYPNASLRDCQRHLSISSRTIRRILKKFHWKPYSYHHVQHLEPNDLIRRVEFCEWFLVKSQEDPLFTTKIIWCDEAKFSKNGLFNRHNSHFWADENHHVFRERAFQYTWNFNVFCAIKNDRILSLHIYDDNLTGQRYLNIIQNVVVPCLNTLRNEEVENAWFQQDGAPVHNTRLVAEILEGMFQDRWIGNNGPFHWPARSPDLTPLDFYIWGYVKNKVYTEPVTTKDNMMGRVLGAFHALEPVQIRRATHQGVLKEFTNV